MILIYQVRHYKHTEAPCPSITCPVCKQAGGVSLAVYQKYVWMLGPIMPSAKYGLAGCIRCGEPIPNVRWTADMETAFRRLKAPLKTPRRLWRGMTALLIIIVALLGTGVVLFQQKRNDFRTRQKLKAEMASAPKAGDIYQVIVPDNGGNIWYTYARFSRLAGDTLFVSLHNRTNPPGDQWKGLDTDSPDAFRQQEVPLSFTSFKKDQSMRILTTPGQTMTLWGLKRGGQLIKVF